MSRKKNRQDSHYNVRSCGRNETGTLRRGWRLATRTDGIYGLPLFHHLLWILNHGLKKRTFYMNFWCFYCFEKEKKRERSWSCRRIRFISKKFHFLCVCSSLYCHTEARSTWMKTERWFLFLLFFFFQRRAGASLRAVRGCYRDLISKPRESSWWSTNGLTGRFQVVRSRFETRWKINPLALLGGRKQPSWGKTKKKDFTLNFQNRC